MALTLALQALTLLLVFSPPMLIGAALCDSPAWANLVLLFVSVFLCLLSSAYLGSKRLRGGLPVLLVSLALCLWMDGLSISVLPAAGALLVGCGMALRQGYGKGNRLLEMPVVVLGLLCYAFGYAICFFSTPLRGLCSPLGWLCLLFLALLFLQINRMSVKEASGGQARRMLGGNQALTLGFLGLLAAVVAVRPLWRWIVGGLHRAFVFILGLFYGEAEGGGASAGGQMGNMDLSALGEGTPMPEWLRIAGDVLLYVVTIPAMLALLGLIGFALYKLGKELYKKFLAWFQGFRADNGPAEYEEESEQLLSGRSMAEEFRKDVGKRLRRLFTRPVPWERLDPAQRVRRLYAELLRRLSPSLKGARCLTPDALLRVSGKEETGFASLYNAVRYGDSPADAESAERARRALRSR